MFNGPYVAINQLIKSKGKVARLENFLLYMLKENICQSNKRWW
jgi:hypothetical protein